MAKLSVEPLVSKLEVFQLYETEQRMYVVASDSERTNFRMLKIRLLPEEDQARIGSLAEILSEDATVYSELDLNRALADLHVGNASTGGLKHVLDCSGLVGFNRFIGCYYLTVITQRRCVGRIGTNKIYAITGVDTIPLRRVEHDPEASVSSIWGRLQKRLNPTMGDTVEQRYRELFHTVDLTRDFFFSYTYDLTHSLQFNMLATAAQNFPPPPPQEIFMWNHYLLEELDSCVRPKTQWFWLLPVIHGAFQTKRLSLFSRVLSLTLIARRSRHFAGPRYLKRGVNDSGHVANDVELEQVLHEAGLHEGKFSSVLQVRGSIPTFWTQATNWSMPKPPIQIKEHDHPAYEATRLHFAHLVERYGPEIHLLDLVKLREGKDPRTTKKRETLVGEDYRNAVKYINSDLRPHQRMQYMALDFSSLTKVRNVNLVKGLAEIARWSMGQTSLFCSHPKTEINTDPPSVRPSKSLCERESKSELEPTVQRGVLRTNCIDCLDRTNVAQFCVGAVALGIQLNVLGIEPTTEIRYDSPVVQALMEMYTSVGDIIALQYGGSEAQKKVDVGGASSKQLSMKQHSDIMTSAKRHLTNTFRDKIVQSAMNLFLGHFRPFTDSAPNGVPPALLGSATPDPAPSSWTLAWAFGSTSVNESSVEHKHQIATLWDLDDDFFLHNKKALRRATPAILVDEWKFLEGDVEDPMADHDEEDEECDVEFEASGDNASHVNLESSKRKKNVLRRAFRRASKIMRSRKIQKELIAEVQHYVAEPIPADEIEKRLKAQERRHQVEQWCRKEFLAASQWWDDAVVRHQQKLQWMRLGPPPAIDMLDRFERLYTPKELTSFDDIFKDEMYISVVQYEVPILPQKLIRKMPPVPMHTKDRSWDLGPRMTFSAPSLATDSSVSPQALGEEEDSPLPSPLSSGGLNMSGDALSATEMKFDTRSEPDAELDASPSFMPSGPPGRSRSYTEGTPLALSPRRPAVSAPSFVTTGSGLQYSSPAPNTAVKRAESMPAGTMSTSETHSPASVDLANPSGGQHGEEEDEAERSFTIGGFMMDLGTRLVRSLRPVRRFQNPEKRGPAGIDPNSAGSYFSKGPQMEFIGKANAPDSSVVGNETYAQLAANVSQYETYGNEDIEYDWKHNESMTDFILESTDAFKLFQLAEKSHCTFELSHGPYKDLPQTFDARDLQQLTASVAPIVDHSGHIRDWDEVEGYLEKEQKGLRKMFGRKTSATIVDMIKTARETDLELVREYEAATDLESLRQKRSTLMKPEDEALYLSYLDPFREENKKNASAPPTDVEPRSLDTLAASMRYPELLAISNVEPTVFIGLHCRGLFDDVKPIRRERSQVQDGEKNGLP